MCHRSRARPTLRLPLRALLLLLAMPIAAHADEASFGEAMETLRDDLQSGQWEETRDALLALLESEGPQAHVLRRRDEIVDVLQRCAVRAANPAPDLKDLIKGRVRSYNPRTRKIHLTYTVAQMTADFESVGSSVYLHPVHFSGSYSIEVSGKSLPHLAPPSILVCVQGDEYHQFVPGWLRDTRVSETWLPTQIDKVVGSTRETVDEKKTSLSAGKAWKATVSVNSKQVLGRAGRVSVKADKRPDLWGRFGVGALPRDAEIVVKGRVNSSWATGLIDEAMREEDQRFLAGFDVETLLPQWLRGGRGETAVAQLAPENYPWQVEGPQRKNVERFHELLNSGRPRASEEALRSLEAAPASAFPPDMHRYLTAVCHLRVGRPALCVEATAELMPRTPSFAALRVVHGQALMSLGQLPEALASFDEALELRARDLDANVARCQVLLLMRRNDDARAGLNRCRQLQLQGPMIDDLETMLRSVDHGPNWPQRFEADTEHYRIASDIDAATCRATGITLEKMHALLSQHLGPAEGADFEVYVFAGQEGYKEYTADAFLGFPHSTAGLYSSLLKQLVIWNLPNRDQMMSTVRHECVHQYLDATGAVLPTWFEEGLAEYLAHVKVSRTGRYQDVGEVDPYQLRLLRANLDQLMPLEHFVQMHGAGFYRLGELGYLQAWALVLFLHRSPDHEDIPASILRASHENVGVARNVEEALGERSLEELHAEFVEFLKTVEESR